MRIVTLNANDASPAINRTVRRALTNNSSSITISDIDFGRDYQELLLIAGDANTTLADNANINWEDGVRVVNNEGCSDLGTFAARFDIHLAGGRIVRQTVEIVDSCD